MSSSNTAFVDVGVCNVYVEPAVRSEVDTQAVLWERLMVLEERQDMMRVRTEDGQDGWISSRQVVAQATEIEGPLPMVTAREATFYRHRSHLSARVREVPAGAYVLLEARRGRWTGVRFPGGELGWTERVDLCRRSPRTPRTLVGMARSYLGVSYLWGGKTPWGFDCSGLVQLAHKIAGIAVRRNAWMQHEDARPVSGDYRDARAGDLLFFSDSPPKITHVAICVAPGEVVHASGRVRLDSMDERSAHYNPRLRETFVSAGTFMD